MVLAREIVGAVVLEYETVYIVMGPTLALVLGGCHDNVTLWQSVYCTSTLEGGLVNPKEKTRF